MRKFTRILAATGLAVFAGGALADPVEGIWQTEVDEGAYAHVTIAPCADKYCGVISRTFNAGGEYSSENKGKPIVWDMQPKGGGAYAEGKIWQPSTGKVYRSKMEMTGNVLEVSGCVGPFCKSQSWRRVQ
ncbi:DUF2147 domain-containing protein [Pseudooceanicola algae]|uniref:Uncharacterized protein n=1 Tax=Pseudooceanicola algae TaxID=1537215 RepID=A0A418SCC1_9RHOB|nr:DUF2147 domain-containing protein [Pseudooceanicola algae]QPM90038.1 hypothetical protein PSAL_012700 [Pseudooceanicola algae]